jgi:hypothetical protein
MDFTTWLILAYFAMLAINLRKRWGVIDGPWLFFFRAFFPNWKFYHGIQLSPRLYVRGQSDASNWTDWQLIYPRLTRKALHLIHNPEVNLALAHQNLVDHLANDINDLEEGEDIRDRVTYQLVEQLARQAISGACWDDQAMLPQPLKCHLFAFQFQVRMEMPDGQNSQLMLQSPVVER